MSLAQLSSMSCEQPHLIASATVYQVRGEEMAPLPHSGSALAAQWQLTTDAERLEIGATMQSLPTLRTTLETDIM